VWLFAILYQHRSITAAVAGNPPPTPVGLSILPCKRLSGVSSSVTSAHQTQAGHHPMHQESATQA